MMLKLRRKVSPPEQVREIPPFVPTPKSNFIPGAWYSGQFDPPFPGKYDSRCGGSEYIGDSGNIWDGKDWFWSEAQQVVGRTRTESVRKQWFWRMPK